MVRKIIFTPTADGQLTALEQTPSNAVLLNQVRKAIGYLELDPHHPGLHTHEFTSLSGAKGEKIFEAYAQNSTPGPIEFSGITVPMKSRERSRLPLSPSLRSRAIHSGKDGEPMPGAPGRFRDPGFPIPAVCKRTAARANGQSAAIVGKRFAHYRLSSSLLARLAKYRNLGQQIACKLSMVASVEVRHGLF